mgnify:CR=1 FL=1
MPSEGTLITEGLTIQVDAPILSASQVEQEYDIFEAWQKESEEARDLLLSAIVKEAAPEEDLSRVTRRQMLTAFDVRVPPVDYACYTAV